MIPKYCILLFLSVFYQYGSSSFVRNIVQWSVSVKDNHTTDSGITGIYTVGKKMGYVLPNMYYLKEDSNVKWLANESWNFTTEINGTTLLQHENVNLVLDGVDTFAEVIFNGNKIGFTENMFRQYIFDVKKYLVKGNNELRLEFVSPLKYAKTSNSLYKYVIPPECPDAVTKGDCYVNKIRKMQASFSWDWGPSVPSIGIWKKTHLEAFDETMIRFVVVDTELVDKNWKVNVDVYFQNNKKNSVSGTLLLHSKFHTNLTYTINLSPNSYGEVVFSTSILVPTNMILRWWPNGYGLPNMYFITAIFTSAKKEENSKTVLFGFRTVELVQDPIGTNGLSFYLKVNGIPIFAKGSNLIPVDLLPENGGDPKTVTRLLSAAKAAHMNMLRVWGGGVYESNELYDLADSYGIMIWQDFMFACALYPSDANFLENVLQEVRYQVKRLRFHPSIVLFSGNNENEGALVDNWYGINNKTVYAEDYVKLYVKTIKTELERVTHGRALYVTSSPSNGLQSEKEGYLSKNPSSSYYGDVHFYDYDSNSFNPNTYPIPRFASEYGFQSLPSENSFLMDTKDVKDLRIDSDFMVYRQHHPLGTDQLYDLIHKQLTLPPEYSSSYNVALIYYSQIVQAYSYKIQTERYRNYRSILTSDGRGHTMGALYWQLNDVWTAPTWSSIDYYGRWKMLQYYAIKFFSPIIVSGHLESTNALNIYVATDRVKVNETVSIRLYKWGSITPVHTYTVDVDVPAGSSKLVYQYNNLSTSLQTQGCKETTCFMTLTLPGAPDNVVFPAKLKESNVNTANVHISSVVQKGTEFDIEVTSDNIALFVWLDAHSIIGTFSDNGFLQIGGTTSVKFNPEDTKITLAQVKEALTVTHLKNPKYFS